MGGKNQRIVVAVDMGTGSPLAIAQVEEEDPQAFILWLKPLVEEFGVEVILSDECPSYGMVAEKLGLEHGLYLFHLLQRVKKIIGEMPDEGGKLLFELYKEIGVRCRTKGKQSPLYRLCQFILRLSDNGAKYLLHWKGGGISGTNNRTEQVIGKLKIRSKSVRGYKCFRGLDNRLFLACSWEW